MNIDFSNFDTYPSTFGVLGTIATLLGLYIAIREARKAGKAARRAEEQAALAETAADIAAKAVQTLRDTIRQSNTIASLTSAMNGLEEIKRLQRNEVWNIT